MGNKEQKYLKELYLKNEILTHEKEIFQKYDKNNDTVLQKSVILLLII
jgi:Ca2+-binding EF-hand superfamily protein